MEKEFDMRYEFKTQRDTTKQRVFTCHFIVCNSIKNIQHNQVSSEIGCDGGASQVFSASQYINTGQL